LALSVVYLLRFLAGQWRSMRVIEKEYLPSELPGDALSHDHSLSS
jgi:hypothetical protein